MNQDREIVLNRRATVVATLAILASLLIVASVFGQILKFMGGYNNVYGLIRLFDLDEESNVPTGFSAFLLLVAAGLFTIVGTLKLRERAPFALHWLLLAAAFVYLAVDESAKLHELFSRPTTEALGGGSSGIFYRAWVFPAIAVTLVFAAFFLRFLQHLPPPTRRRFILAGTLYVGGAVGLEIVGGRYAEFRGVENLTYNFIATFEEALEMGAVIVLIHALLTYIEANYGEIRLRFVPPPPREPAFVPERSTRRRAV